MTRERRARQALAGRAGSIAMPLLIVFLVLAVPVTIGSAAVSGQLARSNRAYDQLLEERYAANAGMEYAFWQVLHNPLFDDSLTPSAPLRELTIASGGRDVDIDVTKVFAGEGLEGQGLDIEKTVNPQTATPGVPTTYTYTIKLANIGSDASRVKRVRDLLGPGFAYVPGSTTGFLTSNPAVRTVTGDPSGATQPGYLNNSGSTPYPWEKLRGNAAVQSIHTPALGVWETVPQYWEMTFSAAGQVAPGSWSHDQWIYTSGKPNNKWRWQLQRVSGGTVTELWTSSEKKVSPENTWQKSRITHNAPAAAVQAGDKLRLRLQVFSDESTAANRAFLYRWGGASQHDSITERPAFVQGACEPVYTELTWATEPSVDIPAGDELVLSFQATATKPDGTYYNQAWARYKPWWGDAEIEVYTPPTAPIQVGAGSPQCGGVVVTTGVEFTPTAPGELNTYSFTIYIENTTPLFVPLQHIYDLLPPGFSYVSGSTNGLWNQAPYIQWKSVAQRYELDWQINGNAGLQPGATGELRFQGQAALESGYDYSNEAWVQWRTWDCETCPVGGDLSYSGPSAASYTAVAYDVQAQTGNTRIRSRILAWEPIASIDVVSWQTD